MRYMLSLICLVILSFAAQLAYFHPGAQDPPATLKGGRVPVMVELFTSEGCSSCPPADALLTKLQEAQPIPGAEVIALEEHVDYWDSLGWKDPYSSSDWTMRQQQYAETFGHGSAYTPQMVIDGRVEFVGSREGKAEREILQAARDTKTEVNITSSNGHKVAIHVGRLSEGTPGDAAEVWLAVAESKLQSAVTSGENAGEHLRHTSVLRSLARIGRAQPGQDEAFASDQQLRLDSAWKRDNTCVIVFIQELKSRRILGAASSALIS